MDKDIRRTSSSIGEPRHSRRALEIVKQRYGATTVLITGLQSQIPTNAEDIRIETCPQENCGAFTISLTSAII
jgi:hypothetical protein